MNWDKANLITKIVIVLLVQLLLLFGSVMAALVVGGVAQIILSQAGNRLANVEGLLAGIAVYTACIAGRRHVFDNFLVKLLPTKQEEKK